MILSKEFNRSAIARDSDLTLSTFTSPPSFLSASTTSQIPCPVSPPTIVQFGANSPLEFSRSSSLVAPFVSGIDLNCGCPQSWACAETLGAKLMDNRGLVLDMVTTCRERLRSEGWGVECDASKDAPAEDGMGSSRGRSISVKIRIHKDLRQTVDWIDTVLGPPGTPRNIDWLTIHPRTRHTPSSTPINVEALQFLTEKYGRRVPILVSGDVFTLDTLPYTSTLQPLPTMWTSEGIKPSPSLPPPPSTARGHPAEPEMRPETAPRPPHIPLLSGLMSARALLSNPSLFSGSPSCTWHAVSLFLSNVSRANLPLKLVQHHLGEMLGTGFGPNAGGPSGPKHALLGKKDRVRLLGCKNFCAVVDFLDDLREDQGGIDRF
ncbi:hypothetical protein MKZ38_002581 [Zalerion maritima]|uniref:DUS-like FMN-binding domain-containing protein n=1 Tax=Zalerion maritima TaxID=339359 RepID=A0AAD5RQ28_9PEZI|nr:hypothetical protein MKZ38_002581 [Zalerion maritima]